MNPEQLRQTIARATVPLLAEYETLTTAQIADAGGVDEADLLAVFAGKEAVMQAVVATLTETITAVLNPAEEVRELDEIFADLPLASRLVRVIDVLNAYYRRVRSGYEDLLPPGVPGADTPDVHGGRHSVFPREDQLRSLGTSPELRQAVAKLLEPDEQRLRLPAQVLAAAFVGMTFGGIVQPVGPDQSPLPAEQVVGLILHGALNTR
jgi:hypothetical protein